jgi:hypothetical protein
VTVVADLLRVLDATASILWSVVLTWTAASPDWRQAANWFTTNNGTCYQRSGRTVGLAMRLCGWDLLFLSHLDGEFHPGHTE